MERQRLRSPSGCAFRLKGGGGGMHQYAPGHRSPNPCLQSGLVGIRILPVIYNILSHIKEHQLDVDTTKSLYKSQKGIMPKSIVFSSIKRDWMVLADTWISIDSEKLSHD